MILRKLLILLFITLVLTAGAQEDTASKPVDYISLNGYIKELQTFSFVKNLDNITTDNLLHNRLNFRARICSSVSGALEIRNRIFFGETVKTFPDYGNLVDVDEGFVDMSWLIVNEPSLVFLSQIDRLWLNWTTEKWDIRAGRQRINWGINLAWNANDLFNAYSLIDFDYEERPGADAFRAQRYFENLSVLDIAVQPGKDKDSWKAAALYRFNKWAYDFQVLGGVYLQDIAVGGGWAGNIKNTGFKGEITYFHPQESFADTSGVVSVSISSDFIFKNSLYITGGFLLNTSGRYEAFNFKNNVFTQPLSAKNLMPTKYSFLLQAGYPVTPIFSGSLVTIYAPGVNAVFVMPAFVYSLAQSWDMSLHAQAFWVQVDEKLSNLGNAVFFRLKWSY